MCINQVTLAATASTAISAGVHSAALAFTTRMLAHAAVRDARSTVVASLVQDSLGNRQWPVAARLRGGLSDAKSPAEGWHALIADDEAARLMREQLTNEVNRAAVSTELVRGPSSLFCMHQTQTHAHVITLARMQGMCATGAYTSST